VPSTRGLAYCDSPPPLLNPNLNSVVTSRRSSSVPPFSLPSAQRGLIGPPQRRTFRRCAASVNGFRLMRLALQAPFVPPCVYRKACLKTCMSPCTQAPPPPPPLAQKIISPSPPPPLFHPSRRTCNLDAGMMFQGCADDILFPAVCPFLTIEQAEQSPPGFLSRDQDLPFFVVSPLYVAVFVFPDSLPSFDFYFRIPALQAAVASPFMSITADFFLQVRQVFFVVATSIHFSRLFPRPFPYCTPDILHRRPSSLRSHLFISTAPPPPPHPQHHRFPPGVSPVGAAAPPFR